MMWHKGQIPLALCQTPWHHDRIFGVVAQWMGTTSWRAVLEHGVYRRGSEPPQVDQRPYVIHISCV